MRFFKIFIFALLGLWVSVAQAQTALTKKEKRELIKGIKKDKLQPTKDFDTIFLYKEKIVEVPKIVEKIVAQLAYRDTCDKSRYELRHERRQAENNADKEIELAKIEAKRQVGLLKMQNESLTDSLRLLRKIRRIEAYTAKDTVKQNTKSEIKTKQTALKIEKQKHAPKWRWYHVFGLCFVVFSTFLFFAYLRTIKFF